QRGHLVHAGPAPRRPKIQHDHFATQIAQADLAIGILHREMRGYSVNVARPRTAVTPGQQQNRKSEENDDASHLAIIPKLPYGDAPSIVRLASGVGDCSRPQRRGEPAHLSGLSGLTDRSDV